MTTPPSWRCDLFLVAPEKSGGDWWGCVGFLFIYLFFIIIILFIFLKLELVGDAGWWSKFVS